MTPIVTAFKQVKPDSQITIHLVPCQYKSGQEEEIAKNITGVTAVTSVKDTLKLLLKPTKTKETGAVLYLGGDPFYSRLLSKKYAIPAYAYTEHSYALGSHFSHIFRKKNDGDLMAVRPLQFNTPKDEIYQKYDLPPADYLAVFTGSRPQHFENLLPILAQTLTLLHLTHPSIHPIIQVSPFITDDLLNTLQKKHPIPSAKWIRGDSLEILHIAKLLLTIPGTNNAEAMYLKCPMIVIVPLHRPKYIILDGIAGLISTLPLLGPLLKQIAIRFYLKNNPFISLPNRYFQKKVVPELVGKFTPQDLATTIATLWTSTDQLQAQIDHFSTIDLEKQGQVLAKIIQKISLNVAKPL